jgi:hypothetical protein
VRWDRGAGGKEQVGEEDDVRGIAHEGRSPARVDGDDIFGEEGVEVRGVPGGEDGGGKGGAGGVGEAGF